MNESLIGLFAGLMLGALLGWLAPALVCLVIIVLVSAVYYLPLIPSGFDEIDVIGMAQFKFRSWLRNRRWREYWQRQVDVNHIAWARSVLEGSGWGWR